MSSLTLPDGQATSELMTSERSPLADLQAYLPVRQASKWARLISLTIVLCCSFVSAHTQDTTHWQFLLDSLREQRNITGLMIHVDVPQRNIAWTGATGVSDVISGRKLTGHEPVRIASVTKSFVAITILRLWEEGLLNLSDPIARFISTEHADILVEGGYDPEQITIRHLLTHTSGLFDHGSSPQFISRILSEPQHRWTRTEQIQSSMQWGKPVGQVGERFSYSDTGYILLGEVIEKITGEPLGVALREWIDYDAIGLDETWFEITEEMPQDVLPRAHQYLDTIDTYDFHPSLDLYGGGGIVTTVKDLTEFYRGLFTHDIYLQSSTLDMMLSPVVKSSTEASSLDYRMGIFLQKVHGLDAWTHSGFWGVQVWYVPELDATVAMAVIKQGDFSVLRRILEEVVSDLRKEE